VGNNTTVAAVQASFSRHMQENIDKMAHYIEQAAQQGAQVILLPELYQNLYFCTHQREEWFAHAYEIGKHPAVLKLLPLAKKLGVVLPLSVFEREGPHTFNSLAMVDDNGEIMGVYRKSHIPDGPGYQEKYYFRPGNTGFKTWKTRFGNIGVGICWDQWFPECARAMALQGADILLYPTAIGSEPYDDELDTSRIWQRAMQGHAVSNAMPVVAANRVGVENANGEEQYWYGHSFISDQTGDVVQHFAKGEEGVLVHSFDFEALQTYRSVWGFFRDRREDLY